MMSLSWRRTPVASRVAAGALMLAMLVAGADLVGTRVAASVFRVAPVTVEVFGDGKASVMTVSNQDQRPITVQIRLFRWTQDGGEEHVVPTDRVVASPPVLQIAPGASRIVRVVRVEPAPAVAEEAYRILLDEVPDPRNARGGDVMLLLRQSVPVFFGASLRARADVRFALAGKRDAIALAATNAGPRRVRLSGMTVRDATGKVLLKRDGLYGYVLARTGMRWPLAVDGAVKWPLSLEATTDQGPVHATLAEPQAG